MTARKNQSWEDFKREQFGGRTEDIEGVTVRVPTDVPFLLQDLAESLSADSKAEDFDEVVTMLYGDGVFKQWCDAGIGPVGLMTALMWGMVQGSGRDITFTEAYELVTSDDPGKALASNRAARRAASKSPSASTGGRSKRTSSASTSSARTRSRA
ncbi:hypothetical protein AB0D99_31905 [Streptomyces sp. NPDC047971]|uniref:hypothetical protein n=1 Tax=Streptomyces sp. NPDC047971 TaxID=3154499 RepID=UPI0033D6B8FD